MMILAIFLSDLPSFNSRPNLLICTEHEKERPKKQKQRLHDNTKKKEGRTRRERTRKRKRGLLERAEAVFIGREA